MFSTRPYRLGRLAVPPALALALASCSIMGGGKPDTIAAAATTTGSTAQANTALDASRYIGPDYCPEVRIVDGAQLKRDYERGHDDDPDFVVWQASISKTARECRYDLAGNLTIKVGVSGRLIAGPKGSPSAVTVPIKIGVVKYQESVLKDARFETTASIPAAGSAVFSAVQEIQVPSPGNDRDYIVYVGLDVGKWDLMTGSLVAKVEKKKPAPPPIADIVPEPEAAPAPVQRKKPKEPNTLPTPSDGFVLPGG